MPDFLEYDPLTGVRRLFDYDEMTGQAWIRTETDVEPLLNQAQADRNTRTYDGGIKKGFLKYCEIDPVTQLELRKKGIDIYSKDPVMIRRMFQEIETNYPKLKSTNKVMWRPKS